MPDVTINVPNVGLEAYFSFKEPINYFIRNKYNIESLNIKLKVVSIITMSDMIRSDLRDPYSELYLPANISEVDYKKDLLDNVPIISFSYIDKLGIEKYIRSPLNYIESFSNVTNVEYINKLLILDLNRLPTDLDLSLLFTDLADFIETRTGVNPIIKEVNLGSVELVDIQEHETRETIRKNTVTVHKTLSTQLAESNLAKDQILLRLNELGIVLG